MHVVKQDDCLYALLVYSCFCLRLLFTVFLYYVLVQLFIFGYSYLPAVKYTLSAYIWITLIWTARSFASIIRAVQSFYFSQLICRKHEFCVQKLRSCTIIKAVGIWADQVFPQIFVVFFSYDIPIGLGKQKLRRNKWQSTETNLVNHKVQISITHVRYTCHFTF